MLTRRRLSSTTKIEEIHPPQPCKPVSGSGRMGPEGWLPENRSWLPMLTKAIRPKLGFKIRVGLDPRTIDPDVLTRAGHPRRSASACLRAFFKDLQKERDLKKDRGLKRLRSICLDCAESSNGVKDCSIINCPLWAHRLGTNPYNRRSNT